MGSNTFKLVMICQYYINEERQLCFAFFSLWCLFVLLVPKGGGVGGWCSTGKRLKLTICH